MKIQTKKYKVISGNISYEFVASSLKVKVREKVLVRKNTASSKKLTAN